jgi:hypothetical protein
LTTGWHVHFELPFRTRLVNQDIASSPREYKEASNSL